MYIYACRFILMMCLYSIVLCDTYVRACTCNVHALCHPRQSPTCLPRPIHHALFRQCNMNMSAPISSFLHLFPIVQNGVAIGLCANRMMYVIIIEWKYLPVHYYYLVSISLLRGVANHSPNGVNYSAHTIIYIMLMMIVNAQRILLYFTICCTTESLQNIVFIIIY